MERSLKQKVFKSLYGTDEPTKFVVDMKFNRMDLGSPMFYKGIKKSAFVHVHGGVLPKIFGPLNRGGPPCTLRCKGRVGLWGRS